MEEVVVGTVVALEWGRLQRAVASGCDRVGNQMAAVTVWGLQNKIK